MTHYCRFHITFQSAVPKFVVNFANYVSKFGRWGGGGGDFATKFAISFQSSNFDCKQMFIVGVEITV